MRLVAAAVRSRVDQPKANVDALTSLLHRYRGGADAVLTCEAYVQGFDALTFDPEPDRTRALRAADPLLHSVRDAVRSTGVAAGVGFFEQSDGAMYSSYAFITPDTERPAYRRVSRGWRTLSSDPETYREGEAPISFAWQGKRLATALCGDLFTDRERFMHLDVDLLLWPLYVCWTPAQWRDEQLGAYAAQTAPLGCPVLLINGVNLDSEGPSYGGAALLDAGTVRATAGFDGSEQHLIVEV